LIPALLEAKHPKQMTRLGVIWPRIKDVPVAALGRGELAALMLRNRLVEQLLKGIPPPWKRRITQSSHPIHVFWLHKTLPSPACLSPIYNDARGTAEPASFSSCVHYPSE
jgi:hypothetical protein